MSDKLRGEMFWTNLWHNSSGFLLPLEPRGLYREMLTRAWSLGGYLPADPETIQRLVNVSRDEWNRCWPKVKQYWKQSGSKIYNETQREVLNESLTLREKRALAGSKGGKAKAAKTKQAASKSPSKPLANPKQSCPMSLSLSWESSGDANNDTPPTPQGGNGRVPSDFEKWYAVYPRKVGHLSLIHI